MISVRAALGAAQDYGVAGFGRSRVPPVHGAARTKTPLVRAALGAAQDYGKGDFRAVASPARTWSRPKYYPHVKLTKQQNAFL